MFNTSREPALFNLNPQLKVLRTVPYLSHLSSSQLADLHRRMSVRRWYGGAIIVGQDEPGDALYVVAKGRARSVLFGENGREMTLADLGPGDTFGETALLDGEGHASNLVAVEDVAMLALNRAAFCSHLAACPETSLKLMAALASRVRQTTEIVKSLALHDVSSRLMRTLVNLADERGEPMDDGMLIRRRPTQQELANMMGTCRETVSRALTALARRDLLVSHGRSIFLTRALMDGLAEAA